MAQIVLNKKITEKFKCDVSASFQRTIAEILITKTRKALDIFRDMNKKQNTVNIVVAGGVAANKYLRGSFKSIEKKSNIQFFFPYLQLCTDNGAMIAYAGIERYEKNLFNKLNFKPRPRWPLDKKAVFMKGKR